MLNNIRILEGLLNKYRLLRRQQSLPSCVILSCLKRNLCIYILTCNLQVSKVCKLYIALPNVKGKHALLLHPILDNFEVTQQLFRSSVELWLLENYASNVILVGITGDMTDLWLETDVPCSLIAVEVFCLLLTLQTYLHIVRIRTIIIRHTY